MKRGIKNLFVGGRRFLRKKGISPVIATVLLIAMVVVIGLIIFLWFRGMVGESVTKFGKNIKLVCEDVDFDASYSSGMLSLVNTGNVPIFRMNVKMSGAGEHRTEEIEVDPEGVGLRQGATFSGAVDVGSSQTITLIPVLIGTSEKGKKTYVCEGEYGKEIVL